MWSSPKQDLPCERRINGRNAAIASQNVWGRSEGASPCLASNNDLAKSHMTASQGRKPRKLIATTDGSEGRNYPDVLPAASSYVAPQTGLDFVYGRNEGKRQMG
ncbi:hypothetical protein MRX96_045153 [Rhipicephalus microplus]